MSHPFDDQARALLSTIGAALLPNQRPNQRHNPNHQDFPRHNNRGGFRNFRGNAGFDAGRVGFNGGRGGGILGVVVTGATQALALLEATITKPKVSPLISQSLRPKKAKIPLRPHHPPRGKIKTSH